MRNFIIIIVIALFGFFVNFGFLGSVGNIILKIVLFIVLSYYLYILYEEFLTSESAPIINTNNPPPTSVKQSEVIANKNILSDNNESIAELLNDKDLSVNSIIISQFEILFSFFIPNNGYIFIETPGEHIRLFYKSVKPGLNWQESSDTPNIIKLIKNHNGDILVENNLNQQSRILPFYDQNGYTPGSAFGLKTNLGKGQAFYFIFDVPVNGFFNEEDFSVPVQVNFTLQYLIKNALNQSIIKRNFNEESIRLKLSKKLNRSSNTNELITEYVEFLAEIFEAHKLTIALVDKNNENIAEIIKTIGQLDSIKEGTRFALDEGLCGKVIINQQVYLIDDIEKDGYFIPRFSKNEKTNFGLRSFLGVPIIVSDMAVGMISLEHKNQNAFTKHHKDLLKEYTNHFEDALIRFYKKKGD